MTLSRNAYQRPERVSTDSGISLWADSSSPCPRTGDVPVGGHLISLFWGHSRGTTPRPAVASESRTEVPSVRTTWAWCRSRSTPTRRGGKSGDPGAAHGSRSGVRRAELRHNEVALWGGRTPVDTCVAVPAAISRASVDAGAGSFSACSCAGPGQAGNVPDPSRASHDGPIANLRYWPGRLLCSLLLIGGALIDASQSLRHIAAPSRR
jgi:hypothetical protein